MQNDNAPGSLADLPVVSRITRLNPPETAAPARKPLSGKQDRAAFALAEDKMSDEAISEEAGINRDTLKEWKKRPDFAARVNEHRETIRQVVLSTGIARVENRIARQNERADALDMIRAERAAANADLPGGKSGFIVRQVKFVKVFVLPDKVQKKILSGEIDPDDLNDGDFIATKQTHPVEESALDAAFMAEYRALENIVAIETGQRVEKKELNAKIDVSQLTDEELERIAKG